MLIPIALARTCSFLRGLSLLFTFTASFLMAQQNKGDSLRALISKAAEDTNKVNALNSLARYSLNEDLGKSRQYAQQAFRLARRLSEDQSVQALKGLANAYHILGLIAFFQDSFPQALRNYSESLAIRRRIGDKAGIAASYNNMAIIYKNMGNYGEALNSHYASLKLEEGTGNKQEAGVSYNNIGIVNEVLQEYDEAIRNYEKAVALAREAEDKQGMANAYNNIGIVRKKQGKYDDALKNYLLALDLRLELGYPKGIFESYNNIGILNYTLGNYKEALENHTKSMALATKVNDEFGIATSKMNMGLLYLRQKQFAKAEPLLNDGLKYYQKIRYKQNIMEAYEAMSAIYREQKNYKRAMDCYILYMAQKDSLLNDRNKKELLQSAMRYEYEKKEAVAQVEQEKKDAIRNEELQKRNTQIKLYITLCILIVLVFAGIFLQLQNKRKTEKLQLENNLIDLEQKALRLQMNPHFIFNALNSIQGFITGNNPQAARKYLSKFARLMRLIMENSSHKTVSLQNEIDVLADYLELTRLRFPEKFDFQIRVGEDLNPEECEIPPMLLQPFVENAVLHGLAAKDADGRIEISFQRAENRIVCVVEDNGIGRRKAMEKKLHSHKSTGMLVTEERLKVFGEQNEVKTSLQIVDLFDTFGNACGTRVILEIPMQSNWT